MQYKKITGSVFLLAMMPVWVSAELKAMDDESLSEVVAQQGLLDIDRFDHAGNNFYRVGMNATIDTSVNVDRLRLTDSAGNDQIDIEALSLSGGVDNGVSSAKITNPFVEFAFEGTSANDDISAREFIGVRFGADSIDGLLSFGDRAITGNDGANPSGINSFRGYIATQPISGTAGTNAVNTSRNISYFAGAWLVIAPGLPCTGVVGGLQRGCVGIDATAQVVVDPLTVGYQSNGVVLDSSTNGGAAFTSAQLLASNVSDVVISNLTVPTLINNIDGSGVVGGIAELALEGSTVTVNVPSVTIPAGNLQISVDEDLGFLHQAQLQNVGGFLSFQNRALDWQGGQSANGAQPGWWMELVDPVSLGTLDIPSVDLPPDTVTQVVDSVINSLLFVNHIEAITGQITAPNVTTGAVTANFTNVPVSVVPINNCWGGSISCFQ